MKENPCHLPETAHANHHLLRFYFDNNQIVEQNREVMAANCSAARAAHQDRRPLDYVCIQADAAAQTAFALPMQSTMTHGTDKCVFVCITNNSDFLRFSRIETRLQHGLRACAMSGLPG